MHVLSLKGPIIFSLKNLIQKFCIAQNRACVIIKRFIDKRNILLQNNFILNFEEVTRVEAFFLDNGYIRCGTHSHVCEYNVTSSLKVLTT